jgi:hypothetical protein
VEAALPRGLVLVGDGATRPQLTARLTEALPVSVRSAARSRTAALHGAGMAALAARRHPAVAVASTQPAGRGVGRAFAIEPVRSSGVALTWRVPV